MKADASDATAPSTFESQPKSSSATTGYTGSMQLQEESSVFESKPGQSIAHVSSSTAVSPDLDAPSVCESIPAASTAHVKAGDPHIVIAEEPSVCESTPAQSK